MPTTAEKNQFKRYVGNYGATTAISDQEIDSYLNDATLELTADFTDSAGLSSPVADFDNLVPQYKPEVVLHAAIQWWWNKAAVYASEMRRANVGDAHTEYERWERAMEMIKSLSTRYSEIQALGTDISMGNLSRFSKQTLTRHGGVSEEESVERY